MKQFNVLDRAQSVHGHYLLEASAGTGKTFSIENIVVRLLLEPASSDKEPVSLEKILVVTFTRAATRDLRLRIRTNIERSLRFLVKGFCLSESLEGVPDYLCAILEKGETSIEIAKKRLRYALFIFDRAQIFTIHSFCSGMLGNRIMESDIGFHSQTGEEAILPEELRRVVQDFFLTEIREDSYSPAQISIYLREDPEQKKLIRAIQNPYDFIELPNFASLFYRFSREMRDIKQALGVTGEILIEDFTSRYLSYKNYKAGETKAETSVKALRFARLFDKDSWEFADLDLLIRDGLVWLRALDPSLLKARSNIPSNPVFSEFFDRLEKKLDPVVREASDFSFLLVRLAGDCRKLLCRYLKAEEKLTPDDLLSKMYAALDRESFLKEIRDMFHIAIFDEFQDTDPIQWAIFKRLFLPEDKSWNGFLYLVGDPKQSIYSFRQADIYTYLSAACALGQEHCFSLDTNYRSDAHLVQALNTLFSFESIPGFISLPKLNSYLPYQPVLASKPVKTCLFKDDKQSVHFFTADARPKKKPIFQSIEQSILLPYICREIENLVNTSGISFNQIAVLVRDRYQALRLTEIFRERKIPYNNQRGTSLVESPVLSVLLDLFQAVLNPYDTGIIKKCMGGILFGWTSEEVKDQEKIDRTLLPIMQLRHSLSDKGVSVFFNDLFHCRIGSDGLTVPERLLKKENGEELYRDLLQVISIIIDFQYIEWFEPSGIIPLLNKLRQWDKDEDVRVKRLQDPAKNGVKILTLHVSKGLEFDIVFALGLVNADNRQENMIPVERSGKRILVPLTGSKEENALHREEIDAEKMRQLYVAMTRAKYRLYVPTIMYSECLNVKIGEASPIELFLARLGREQASHSAIYERINAPCRKEFFTFLDGRGVQNFISYSIHGDISLGAPAIGNENYKENLIPPRSVIVSGNPQTILSFSSMATSKKNKPENEERLMPHDFDNDDKTIHTLPACNELGIILHTILEKVSFSSFKTISDSAPAFSVIRPYIRDTKFKGWEPVIEHLIGNVLSSPLSRDDPGFCLANIDPGCMYREMPFMYPYTGNRGLKKSEFADGFIKGCIDLLFLYENKYYIIDWKSNWLGNRFEDYHSEAMARSMADHEYFLQASIYAEALRRYLKLVDTRLFKECFGGVYYLFMRGMQPGGTTGIFSIDADSIEGPELW